MLVAIRALPRGRLGILGARGNSGSGHCLDTSARRMFRDRSPTLRRRLSSNTDRGLPMKLSMRLLIAATALVCLPVLVSATPQRRLHVRDRAGILREGRE